MTQAMKLHSEFAREIVARFSLPGAEEILRMSSMGVLPEAWDGGELVFPALNQMAPVPALPVNEFGEAPPEVSGRLIPWGIQCSRLHPDFLDGLLWIENQGGPRMEVLVPCMKFESNINPKARNPQSSASGLIQFMSGTARNLGTTIEVIRSAGPMEQLSWVYRYFRQFGQDLGDWSIEDCYMAILWPAGIGKSLDYKVFVNNPSRSNDAYDVNRGLDIDRNGFVTKREACKKVVDLAAQGLLPQNVLKLRMGA